MTDLFTSHLSKRDRLKLWLKEKGFAKTSEVIKWGSANFSNRAERDARDMAAENDPCIQRLNDTEKAFRGYTGKEDIWKWVK